MKKLNNLAKKLGILILGVVVILSATTTFAFAQLTDTHASASVAEGFVQPLSIGYTDNLTVVNGTFPGDSIFTGYKYLTASGNANIIYGASNYITVILEMKGTGNLYYPVSGATAMLPVDGQSHTLFNRYVISPGATYRLFYSLPFSPTQTSSAYVSIIPWN